MKKRLIALCLALAFVLAALPGNLVSLAAEELADLKISSTADNAPSTESSVVGKVVKVIPSFSGFAYGEPGVFATGVVCNAKSFPELLKIDAVKEVSGTTYYKLVAADGHSWPPHSNLSDGCWMKKDYVEFVEPKNTVVDADGKAVSSVQMGKYEKPVLTANSPFKGENVYYQWQIEYAAGKWVNIHDATRKSVTLSYGMVANLLDAAGKVNVRAMSMSGKDVAYSDAIAVQVANSAAAASAYSMANPSVANNGVMAAAEEGEVQPPKSYKIIIQYQFEDGKQAYAPWTATIAEGQTIQQTVKSPDVLGYKPSAEQETVVLNQVVTGNINIVVVYHPVEVKVTVEHRFQPVNGSNNTDDYIAFPDIPDKELKLLTGSQVGAGLELFGDKLPKGFYALKYDTTTTVAANGSTVITIYYDRNYYLMNFDLAGGYGAEPIYAPVGTPLTGLIKTPVKAGYKFKGWKDAGGEVHTVENFPYDEMPAAATTFTAQWEAEQTTFDVVFWYENANDNGYTQVGTLLDVGATPGQIVNGSTYKDTNFTGKDSQNFTYSHADTNVEVKGDGSTAVNVYFKRNVYTMTFVMGSWANSCTEEDHQHSDDCKLIVCGMEAHSHTANCYKCGQTEGTHTRTCYDVVGSGSIARNATSSNDYYVQNAELNANGLYHYDSDYGSSYDRYYIKVGNSFYRVENANANTKVQLNSNCSHHTHGAECLECPLSEHTHVDSCYKLNCGKHVHYHSGNTCYFVVTAKYDADITAIWDTNPVKAVGDAGYVFRSSITGDYYGFLEKMPSGNITLTKSSMGSVKRTVYYCVEVLPGVEYPTGTTTTHTKNGVTKTYYIYNTVTVAVSSTAGLTYAEDYYPITGFTQLYTKNENWGSSLQSGSAYLYYTRDTHTLTFSNHGNVVSGKGGSFLYQADISGQYFVPDYPTNLEPNAYVFDGWYESPFFGDTKFEFTSTDEDGKPVKATMPAHDVTLYARWVPKNHTVKLYLTSDKTQQIGTTETVAHRDTATKPQDPTNGSYDFVGWFYMDGTTEKAFDFSMPVTQDLELYAKWSSNVLVQYTIYYKLKDGTIIAPTLTGQALAGTAKTFEAKYGDELNEPFRSGYYPETKSSTVVRMSAEGSNEFTFYYVEKNSVKYTVKYLEYGTNKQLKDPKVVSTKEAIVTENFVYINGYMPDAYSKTEVVTADDSTEIVFYYTKDAEHAPVRVVHMTQNAVGSGYTIYQEFTDLNGVIGESYSATILNIVGFDFDHATTAGANATPSGNEVTGTVTEQGLEIIIYYNREVYEYEFQFREQGTGKELADAVTGSGRYGAQVSQNAAVIRGYSCISGNSQTITIQIVEDGTKNIKIFYYVEEKVDIRYEMVGPSGAGSLTTEQEVQVPVKTGEVMGSSAVINPNYKFVGWFYDQQCTQPVDAAWVSGNKITPQKNADGLYESATYFAKFEYNLTSLTIVKNGAEDWKDIDPNQTFIFNISGNGLNLDVTVHGDEEGNWKTKIDGLTVGATYTITEKTDWSWRYEPTSASQNKTLAVNAEDNVVTFTNTRPNEQWLDGDSWCDNRFN